MNEADILATTYFDTCTIKRAVRVKNGAITREEMQAVYSAIPCAVSSNGGSASGKNDEYQLIEYEDLLYTRPEIEVRAGDRVEAVVGGDSCIYEAGQGRRYSSHRQTPLKRKGRA